jgi:ABC-type sugar transport system substrate-binding protein
LKTLERGQSKSNPEEPMISKVVRTAILATALASGLASALPAQAQTPIGVSYQPSLYWALPF